MSLKNLIREKCPVTYQYRGTYAGIAIFLIIMASLLIWYKPPIPKPEYYETVSEPNDPNGKLIE